MKPTVVLDTEVYKDYFLAAFYNPDGERTLLFELYDGHPLDVIAIKRVLSKCRIVTFNGINFDLPILTEALNGFDPLRLKGIANRIIERNEKYWQIGIEPIACDHIDLIEVAPGIASIKIYGGRLHCPKLQDLPIDPDASISPEDRERLKTYCVNDLHTTWALFNALKPQIELRERMSERYQIDLRSKSDAQIAEAVIGKSVQNILKRAVERPEIEAGTRFNYRPPEFLRFASSDLVATLDMVRNASFLVPDSGKVEMPEVLAKAAIRIGNGSYRMGIGGLHSSEQTVSHYSDDEHDLYDRDVVSYYPEIILNLGLRPKQMGEAFSQVYRGIVNERVAAKRAGDKVVADSLKITINGSFGKFGSRWSKLYSPDLLIQTTLTGQLSLLMLIEMLENQGIPVVSANTDGIVVKCPKTLRPTMEYTFLKWEEVTGFQTEETAYRQLHSRDVNNYIAIKPDGEVKLKGAYAPVAMQKNPTNEVCVQAVIAFLRDHVPVEETVRRCQDVRRFVTIRQVKGGAVDQQGQYLGKAVRWYYAKGIEGAITYKMNGHTVARSTGAKPLMEMDGRLPDDIDYDWYIQEANSILSDIGVNPTHYIVKDLI